MTTVPVHIECTYPILSANGILINHVNRQLNNEAESHFNRYVREEIFAEEIWEERCILGCEFFLIYQTSNLISILGCDSQIRDCRGCTYYQGKTFWQKEDSVNELILDDLFIKDSSYREFLLQYCENYFKNMSYGYYSSRKELPPELKIDDLDIFFPTDKALMIIFRSYTVSGWADGPDVILIPYAKLKQFINPFGPLKELL